MSSEVRPPWQFESPLCAEMGVELYYLDEGENREMNPTPEYKAAKEMCNSCIHAAECKEWGVYHERWGIWGGSTPYERRLIRRERNIILESIELQAS